MSKNPCTNCNNAFEYYSRHFPNRRTCRECKCCEKRSHYEEYLKSRRKYEVGDPIKNIDELLKQDVVMFCGRTKNIAFIKNFQLQFILNCLSTGRICKAVKKKEVK
mgnify:CR=1 FL=1